MKKIFEGIREWTVSRWQRMRARRAERKSRRLERECEHRVQVMEFRGRIYLSLDGVPVVDTKSFRWNMEETMTSARRALYEWRRRCEE